MNRVDKKNRAWFAGLAPAAGVLATSTTYAAVRLPRRVFI